MIQKNCPFTLPYFFFIFIITCFNTTDIFCNPTENIIQNPDFIHWPDKWHIEYKSPSSAENSTLSIQQEKQFQNKNFFTFAQSEHGICVLSSSPFLLGNNPYKLKFVYKTDDGNAEQKIRIRIQIIDKNGTPLPNWYIWETLPPSTGWKIFEKELAFPENLKIQKGTLSILFHDKGTFYIGDISLKKIDAEKVLTYKGEKFYFSPRNEKNDPELAPEIKASSEKKGYILYSRNNPRFLYPDSVPQPEEITNNIVSFGAQEQTAMFWLMLFAIKDLQNVMLTVKNDLTSEKGDIIGKDNVSIKLINFWPQRSNYFGSMYYIIPELLFDKNITNISRNNSTGFLISVNIPEKAKPGTYLTELQCSSENGIASNIKLKLIVLPFKLQEPDNMSWGISLDVFRWDNMSDSEILEELERIREYGFNGPIGILCTDIKIHEKDGTITDVDIPRLSKFLKANKILKLKNPLELSFGPNLEIQVAKALELNTKITLEDFPKEDMSNEKLKEGFIAVLTIIKNKIENEWYFFGQDEGASGGTKRLARLLWEYSLAKRANVKTINSYYISYDKDKALLPYLDASWSMSLEEGKIFKANKLKFWLNGGGTYGRQEGGIMPNRYLTGFMTYKSGADVNYTWTYQRIIGSPLSDFDQCSWNPESKDYCLVYPAKEFTGKNGGISTLQWEGKREGITDYKYIHTLQYWIKRAKAEGFEKIAEESQNKLDSLIAAIPDDMGSNQYILGNSYSEPGNFTNEDADTCRWIIASEIMKLKKVIEEEGNKK